MQRNLFFLKSILNTSIIYICAIVYVSSIDIYIRTISRFIIWVIKNRILILFVLFKTVFIINFRLNLVCFCNLIVHNLYMNLQLFIQCINKTSKDFASIFLHLFTCRLNTFLWSITKLIHDFIIFFINLQLCCVIDLFNNFNNAHKKMIKILFFLVKMVN
jgi:hypothetical protein